MNDDVYLAGRVCENEATPDSDSAAENIKTIFCRP